MARKFTGYFDSGAYTRLSSYAIIKAVGHLPGPYTIPNVSSDVYCVYTNRTPATAMRGFGITGVDFAIECHMDKVAHVVGMDPIELRILNAYRDGDMKAHRRLAKNTALVECCQVAAEKALADIGRGAPGGTSLTGGGGARAAFPHTATDRGTAGRWRPNRARGYAAARSPSARNPLRAPAAPSPPAAAAAPLPGRAGAAAPRAAHLRRRRPALTGAAAARRRRPPARAARPGGASPSISGLRRR